jgi:signal transduction histidine kinase
MNRKILFQVTAPAILTGLLLVGSCLLSAWSIDRLQRNLSHILSRNVASLQAALDLENQTRQMRYHSFVYLMKPTPAGLRQIEQDEGLFEEALQRAVAAANTPVEQAHLRQIDSGYHKYQAEMARLREEVKTKGPHTDFTGLAERHPIRHIVTPCQELGKVNREQLGRTAAESNELSGRSRLVLLLLGLAGPAGGLLCGYGIVRGLTRSITRLSVRVRDVVDSLPGPLPQGEEGIDVGSVQVDVRGGDGDLVKMDRQLQDVVERIAEVTEELQRQHREVYRAQHLAAVGRLAAGVAHEVRNPLTGMKLLVEAALRPRNPQPLSEEDLRVIHGEIARLEETVQNFLAFARPQPLCRSVVDLREALGRPLDLVRARARQHGVVIAVGVPPDPVPVFLDAGQFNTVLVNLLLNALDAMPRGGGLRLEIEVATSGSAGATCRLSVCDTGPGIAPEMVDRLFTPFASTKATGTGLGLSLARRIVEEHGGRITGANQAKGGACFTVVLPLDGAADLRVAANRC